MRPRRLALGRNAHQPLDFETVALADSLQEGVGLQGSDPGLLRLLPGVDLHIEPRQAALLVGRLHQGLGQALPVQGLDHLEQGHGLPRLVGLQRPDQPQLQPRRLRLAGGPALLSLLHPVLPEHPLPGGQHRGDTLPSLLLGDRRQGHIRGVAPGGPGGRGDARQHLRAGGARIEAQIEGGKRTWQGTRPRRSGGLAQG